MIAWQPDTRRAKSCDALSKMLISRSGLILRQVARGDNQITLTLLGLNGIQYGLIAFPGIHT